MTTSTLPPTTTIDIADLRRLRAEDPDVRIIDVRTGGEYERVHIPGSHNIPLDTLGEHVEMLADVSRPVVLVCQSGNRASQAERQLDAAGKQGLSVLEGGIVAWESAGGEVAHGDTSRWAMDRQVRLVAGSLVLAGVVASVAVPKAKWLAGAVAGGLVFSAVTDTCAMATALGKLPYNRGTGCDIDAVLSEL